MGLDWIEFGNRVRADEWLEAAHQREVQRQREFSEKRAEYLRRSAGWHSSNGRIAEEGAVEGYLNIDIQRNHWTGREGRDDDFMTVCWGLITLEEDELGEEYFGPEEPRRKRRRTQ
jgi:hypothetical protein